MSHIRGSRKRSRSWLLAKSNFPNRRRGCPGSEEAPRNIFHQRPSGAGARSALLLFGPFVEKHGLRAKYAPKIEGITGWGIGGPVRSQVARVGRLTLGAVEVRDLVARLSLQRAGVLATGETAALVGPDVLSQFTLVVDYSRRQLVF